jgi:hypothetical protein
MDVLNEIQELRKAISAGGYNVAPSELIQGSALQKENLAPVMENVCIDEKQIKFQKTLRTEDCPSTLLQFNRQLSYGVWGGAAQLEGFVGGEQTSDYARIVVPISYYSHLRRNTFAADMVATFDGKKASERAATDAAIWLAGNIEFDIARGRADFSNGGVFDGNPLAIWSQMPNMLGMDPQIRQSDYQRNAQDQMMGEYGTSQTVVISCGAPLTQDNVEDASVRSAINNGNALKLWVDELVLSAYNKITFGKERIMLAGSPQGATGGDLRKQWTSSGTVDVEASAFLRGKVQPARTNSQAPGAPSSLSVTSTTVAGVVTPFLVGQVYKYFVTACNELGESAPVNTTSGTIAAAGDEMVLAIGAPASGTYRYFNVYRSAAGGSVCRFIGRVVAASSGSTAFLDLGNRLPGAVTGFLVDDAASYLGEMCPYTRQKMAIRDLANTEAYYRFLALAMQAPRKSVILDNLKSYNS